MLKKGGHAPFFSKGIFPSSGIETFGAYIHQFGAAEIRLSLRQFLVNA